MHTIAHPHCSKTDQTLLSCHGHSRSPIFTLAEKLVKSKPFQRPSTLLRTTLHPTRGKRLRQEIMIGTHGGASSFQKQFSNLISDVTMTPIDLCKACASTWRANQLADSINTKWYSPRELYTKNSHSNPSLLFCSLHILILLPEGLTENTPS